MDEILRNLTVQTLAPPRLEKRKYTYDANQLRPAGNKSAAFIKSSTDTQRSFTPTTFNRIFRGGLNM
jgi:hypothetical protein